MTCHNAQASFSASGGYSSVAAMLVRVEENLILLAPCSEQSLAVAAGQQQHSSRKSLTSITSSVSSGSGAPHAAAAAAGDGQATTPNRSAAPYSFANEPQSSVRKPAPFPHEGPSEPMGQYGTFARGEFDSYYSTLVMVLLNIVLDDLVAHQLCPGTNLPVLPGKGCEIRNLKAISLLVALLASSAVGLNTVALRVCFALIRLHAPNVAVLEVLGVVAALVEKLLAIVYVGSLECGMLTAAFGHRSGGNPTNYHAYERNDFPASGGGHMGVSSSSDSPSKTEEDLSGPSSDSNGPHSPPQVYSAEVLATVTGEIVLLLQIVAVSTGNRDSSVPALLALVLHHSSSAHSCSAQGDVRCQNCEMEVACLQCLNDGYVIIIHPPRISSLLLSRQYLFYQLLVCF